MSNNSFLDSPPFEEIEKEIILFLKKFTADDLEAIIKFGQFFKLDILELLRSPEEEIKEYLFIKD